MDPFHTITFERVRAKDDTEKSPSRAGVELVFLMAVGAAAGSEAEDGLETILIGLAAVIAQHRS